MEERMAKRARKYRRAARRASRAARRSAVLAQEAAGAAAQAAGLAGERVAALRCVRRARIASRSGSTVSATRAFANVGSWFVDWGDGDGGAGPARTDAAAPSDGGGGCGPARADAAAPSDGGGGCGPARADAAAPPDGGGARGPARTDAAAPPDGGGNEGMPELLVDDDARLTAVRTHAIRVCADESGRLDAHTDAIVRETDDARERTLVVRERTAGGVRHLWNDHGWVASEAHIIARRGDLEFENTREVSCRAAYAAHAARLRETCHQLGARAASGTRKLAVVRGEMARARTSTGLRAIHLASELVRARDADACMLETSRCLALVRQCLDALVRAVPRNHCMGTGPGVGRTTLLASRIADLSTYAVVPEDRDGTGPCFICGYTPAPPVRVPPGYGSCTPHACRACVPVEFVAE